MRMLLRILSSKTEAAAANAFAEIRRIGSSFDWTLLLPDELPNEVREKLLKLMRLVGGAGTLAEAKNAYGKAEGILAIHNATWRDPA